MFLLLERHELRDTAVDSKYASMCVLSLIASCNNSISALAGQRKWSQTQDNVTDGIMTLADDKRPDETPLMELSYYSLQHETYIRYELTHQVVRWHNIRWSLIKSVIQVTEPSW